MEHTLGPCACSQLRRSARAVSALYDEFLAPAGITVTQYAILVNIGRQEDGISRTALAGLLGMDRTTLTRNLRPLEKGKLVSWKTDLTDRRATILRLTPAGSRKIERAFMLWADVQRKFVDGFGVGNFEQLRELLAGAASTAKTVRRQDVRKSCR
jgi:DNA-binding MarR family transcriptional regulator